MKAARTVQHTTFTIERVYPVPPARVFDAFADKDLKERWFAMPPDWVDTKHTMDFRPGGSELNHGGEPGGTVHMFDARYHDIVENQRIVYSYDLYLDDRRMSVSLATVEFEPHADGTRMLFTEQGAFFDDIGDPAEREQGTKLFMDALGDSLLESA